MAEGIENADFFYCDVPSGTHHYPENPNIISVPQVYPWTRLFYSNAEETYDPRFLQYFTRRNISNLSYIPAAIYLVFIWLGPRFMKHRQAFDLRTPLKYWNLLLAVFSIMGALRVVPHVLMLVHQIGFENSLCAPPIWSYGAGTVGLWTILFVYSKIAELLDTVFIILRKKPLNFLHWYHHASVLIYCFDAYTQEQPLGVYFCAMNYTVHGVMYFYYYLAAAMKKAPSWGLFVTVIQVLQMIVGVSMCLRALHLSLKLPFQHLSTAETGLHPLANGECFASRRNLILGLLMYSTYFYLFAKFFVDRYVLRKTHRKAMDDKKSD